MILKPCFPCFLTAFCLSHQNIKFKSTRVLHRDEKAHLLLKLWHTQPISASTNSSSIATVPSVSSRKPLAQGLVKGTGRERHKLGMLYTVWYKTSSPQSTKQNKIPFVELYALQGHLESQGHGYMVVNIVP